MDTELLNSAWQLTLYGISTVIAFLSVLVVLVSVLAALVARWAPAEKKDARKAGGTASHTGTGNAPNTSNAAAAAARAAAQHHHNRG